jgi:hypothetical protein
MMIGLMLVAQVGTANALGITAKGTITGKLLNLSSVSNYDLQMNMAPGGSAGGGPPVLDIVHFKVDGRDLAKPEFRTLALRLGLPTSFFAAVYQIDVPELKAKKKVSRTVYAGLQVDLVYKDETTKDITVDVSGDGMDLTEIVLPRPWLTGQLVVSMEARHRVRGTLTYDLNGVVQGGKLGWEILVEPVPPKAPEKKEEKGKEEAKKPGAGSESPPAPPSSPDIGPRIPEPKIVDPAARSDRKGRSGRAPAPAFAVETSWTRRSPAVWWMEERGVPRAEGAPEPAPPPPEPGPPPSEPSPPPPAEPSPAPSEPSPPPPPATPAKPETPEKPARGADLKALAKFGFSYAMKVDFEIQKDPITKGADEGNAQA